MSLFDIISKFFESISVKHDNLSVVIRDGDTMSEIAEEMTGDGNRWHEAVPLNPGKDLNKIKKGETYIVPRDWA